MITLALDTSTAHGAVALLRDNVPLDEQTFGRDELFAILPPLLARHSVTPTQIGLFAVGLGPGSFTGIRAGIAAIKGLALPTHRPVVGVSSFDALALTVAPQLPPDCPQLCVLADGRQQEVYYALYDHRGQPVRPCRLAPLEAVADEIHDPLWFVSAEIKRFAPDLRGLFGGFASVAAQPMFPSATALGWLAGQRFHQSGEKPDAALEPIYLRETAYKKSVCPPLPPEGVGGGCRCFPSGTTVPFRASLRTAPNRWRPIPLPRRGQGWVGRHRMPSP